MQEESLKMGSSSKALAAILLFSGLVFLFLVWLVYFKERAGHTSELISNLPALNALFNATSTVFLSMGFWSIKKGRKRVHMRYMISAFISSSFFFDRLYHLSQFPRRHPIYGYGTYSTDIFLYSCYSYFPIGSRCPNDFEQLLFFPFRKIRDS